MKKARRSGETLTMFLKLPQQKSDFEFPGGWNSPHDPNLTIEDFSNFPIPPVAPPGTPGQSRQVTASSVDYGPNDVDSPYSVPTGSFPPQTPSTTEDILDPALKEPVHEPSIYTDMLRGDFFEADPYLDFDFNTPSFMDPSQFGNTNYSVTSADDTGGWEMSPHFQFPLFNHTT